MNTGYVFVETVQGVTEDVADVAAKVGGECSNIMFTETNTSDVIWQSDSHCILVLLREAEVLPEVLLQTLLLLQMLSGVAVDPVVSPGDVLCQAGEGGELFAASTDDLASTAEDDAVMTGYQIIQPLQRPHSFKETRERSLPLFLKSGKLVLNL